MQQNHFIFKIIILVTTKYAQSRSVHMSLKSWSTQTKDYYAKYRNKGGKLLPTNGWAVIDG